MRKYKKIFYCGNSPWVKSFLDNISNHFQAYEYSRGITYANYINDIEINNEIIKGNYYEKNNIFTPEIKFPKLRENDIIEDLFIKYPYLFKHLKEPTVQNGLTRGLKDHMNNIIPDWNDLYISCSCNSFDYLKPCKHVVGLFIYLMDFFDKKPETLLTVQGINTDKIKKTMGNLFFFEDYLSKNKESTSNDEINKLEEENNENISLTSNKEISNETEIENIVKQRIGQQKFKQELINLHHKCLLCNIDIQELLIASHIKPWAKSSDSERLDVNNGLLLCPNHDKLFDLGYITFNELGNIGISDRIQTTMYDDLKLLGQKNIIVNNEMKKYLFWHKENIFK